MTPEWSRSRYADSDSRHLARCWSSSAAAPDRAAVIPSTAVTSPMPPAEVTIDRDLVHALLREQHDDLASEPIAEAGEGWDNKQFRLGDDYLVRLPRRALAAPLIEHEQRWLPVLAPQLPIPVPVPLRIGRPGCGFPWAWSVGRWFEGEIAARVEGITDPEATARQLGEFLVALHQPAPADAPANPFRTSLVSRSTAFVERIASLGQRVDHTAAMGLWDDVLDAGTWCGPSVWLHGDLHPANLIVHDGRLAAVIDFGDLTAGDPAVDLAVAWMMGWPATASRAFRAVVEAWSPWVDDATWTRARGWALALGVAYLAHSLDNPIMDAIGERTVAAVLAEQPA
jgi:aminoglycoside phosphotransferase (APT) family kinase protein